MRQHAFTFIELLVVIAILALFFSLSIPALRSFSKGSSVEGAVQGISAAIREARSRTLASKDALSHGVYFNDEIFPHQYTLFKGASYETRDVLKDEITQLPNTLEISQLSLQGGKEVVFLRLSGQASVEGEITIRQIANPSNQQTLHIAFSGTLETNESVPPTDEERVTDSRHVHVPYQGRTIGAVSESVRLVFPDTTFSFAISENMQEGQIFWEGNVTSEGQVQHLFLHTHVFNDPIEGTLFSLHREGGQNTASLEIELSGDATGNLIYYDQAGITSQGTSIYAGIPEIQ